MRGRDLGGGDRSNRRQVQNPELGCQEEAGGCFSTHLLTSPKVATMADLQETSASSGCLGSKGSRAGAGWPRARPAPPQGLPGAVAGASGSQGGHSAAGGGWSGPPTASRAPGVVAEAAVAAGG